MKTPNPPTTRDRRATRPAEASAAPAAGDKSCRYFIDLIYEKCRIRLHEGKDMLIRGRLEKRLRALGLSSLDEYARFLRTEGTEEEFTKVVDALTTNFTSFLRERDHFDYLVGTALPAVLKRGQSKFRIWSAACSSGEEPYTLAIFLSERYPLSEGWDWSVVASDVSTKVLAIAQNGVYAADKIKPVPTEWLHKYFDKGHGASAGQVRVKRELSQRIEFRQVNLMESHLQPQPCEIIFCRNVMIYFDSKTQEQVVTRLSESLVPGGYFFTGHSESLNGLTIPLRFVKPSIYQKPA